MDKQDPIQHEIEATRNATTYRRNVATSLYIGSAIAVVFLFVAICYFTFTKLPTLPDNVLIVWLLSKALVVTAVAGVTARALKVASLLSIPLHERELLVNLSGIPKTRDEKKQVAAADEFQVEQVMVDLRDEVQQVLKIVSSERKG